MNYGHLSLEEAPDRGTAVGGWEYPFLFQPQFRGKKSAPLMGSISRRGQQMEFGAVIIVVLVVVAGLFFGITGFKTRCPNCGVFKLHPKDRERNAKMVQSYNDTVSVGLMDEYSKPGYVNDWLRCVKCDKQYQRHTANEWMNISREFGNDDAILEYKKLQEEIADRKRRRAEAQRSA